MGVNRPLSLLGVLAFLLHNGQEMVRDQIDCVVVFLSYKMMTAAGALVAEVYGKG